MAQIEPETLLPSGRLHQQALAGEVTQIHRGQGYADEGDTFAMTGRPSRWSPSRTGRSAT